MAERYWDGGVDDDRTNVNNWSNTDGGGTPASSVPGTGDHAHFTANGNPNPCVLAEDWTLGDLTVEAGYTAKLDLGDVGNILTMDDGANITLDNGGEFDCGDATISLTNGNFDNQHVATYTGGTSTVVMGGTGTLTGGLTKILNNVVISSGAVITVAESPRVDGAVTIDGTLLVLAGRKFFDNGTGTTIGEFANITGDGEYTLRSPMAGQGITSFTAGGVVDIALFMVDFPGILAVVAPGTYASTLFKIRNALAEPSILTLSNGNYTFTGDLEFENTNAGGNLIIANDTNNPNITVEGDVIWTETAGTITYTKGTGDMVASGLGDQAIDFGNEALEDLEIDKTTSGDVMLTNCDLTLVDSGLAGALTFAGSTIIMEAGSTLTASGGGSLSWDLDGQTIEALVINKSAGTLTFTGAWIASSYMQTLGTVDFNGQTLETTGKFTIIPGALIASGTDTMNGADITVGGDFTVAGVDGTLLNLRGTSAWTLDVTGRATATYVDVSYSNATAGSTVFAQGSTNSFNNSGWNFMVPRSIVIGIDDDAISLAHRSEVILAG